MMFAYLGLSEIIVIAILFGIPGLILFVATVRYLWLQAKR